MSERGIPSACVAVSEGGTKVDDNFPPSPCGLWWTSKFFFALPSVALCEGGAANFLTLKAQFHILTNVSKNEIRPVPTTSKTPHHCLCFINLINQNRCKAKSIGKSINTVKIAGPRSFFKFRALKRKEFGEPKAIIRKLMKNNSTSDVTIETLLYGVINFLPPKLKYGDRVRYPYKLLCVLMSRNITASSSRQI
ncbi:MAG: hypothetical protein G01um101429_534 [Parcubacteria group bacterium Gr01-1014_29]|nr:MAG: hypothetical protein G01um101429_534 [Parcubacteria group bacterium Gr01-1014_29]